MAANRLGIACRHVRDLALSQTTFVDKHLKKLMDMIEIPAAEQKGVGDKRKAKDKSPEKKSPEKKRRTLGRNQSDASVIFCRADCRCDECYKTEVVALSDGDNNAEMDVEPFGSPAKKGEGDDDDRSETSLQAEKLATHVPAARGGQKKKTSRNK